MIAKLQPRINEVEKIPSQQISKILAVLMNLWLYNQSSVCRGQLLKTQPAPDKNRVLIYSRYEELDNNGLSLEHQLERSSHGIIATAATKNSFTDLGEGVVNSTGSLLIRQCSVTDENIDFSIFKYAGQRRPWNIATQHNWSQRASVVLKTVKAGCWPNVAVIKIHMPGSCL